jgi:hypothetical protein
MVGEWSVDWPKEKHGLEKSHLLIRTLAAYASYTAVNVGKSSRANRLVFAYRTANCYRNEIDCKILPESNEMRYRLR